MSSTHKSGILFASANEAEQAFYEALEKGDLPGLMRVWSDDDDVVCIHPNGIRHVGHVAVRQSWQDLLQAGTMLIRPTHRHSLGGMMTAVHTVFEQILSVPMQAPSADNLIHGNATVRLTVVVATNVYVKAASGWRLALHHASSTPQKLDMSESDPHSTLH